MYDTLWWYLTERFSSCRNLSTQIAGISHFLSIYSTGALQPSNYIFDIRKVALATTVNPEQGIQYFQLRGARYPGTRSAIHMHDFSATTHIIEGYATVFLEGTAPKTFGPGETYYMPGGGKTMTSAIMPNPIYKGQPVQQPLHSSNLDSSVVPKGMSGTTWLEIETDSNGEVIFDWTREDRSNCNQAPRWTCYNEVIKDCAVCNGEG